jgi:hypothetical protein
METRALAIAFFYAIGTAIGGITGPYVFGKMIESGKESQVAIAFFLGAAVMALGGIAEIFFGVKAEKAELEDIAKPLTAQDTEQDKRPDEEVAERPEPSRRSRDLGAERSAERRELARLVGARFWGPGRFPAALREAVLSGRAKRIDRTHFGPAEPARGGRFDRSAQRGTEAEQSERSG